MTLVDALEDCDLAIRDFRRAVLSGRAGAVELAVDGLAHAAAALTRASEAEQATLSAGDVGKIAEIREALEATRPYLDLPLEVETT